MVTLDKAKEFKLNDWLKLLEDKDNWCLKLGHKPYVVELIYKDTDLFVNPLLNLIFFKIQTHEGTIIHTVSIENLAEKSNAFPIYKSSELELIVDMRLRQAISKLFQNFVFDYAFKGMDI
jgi:hypothetical protein